MKKHLVALVAILFGVFSSLSAQNQQREQQTPETRAKMRTERLAKQLELSDDVKAQVAAQFLKEEQNMQSMRETAGTDREKMREVMQAERAKNDAELEKIIGAEKMAQVKAAREKAGPQAPQGGQRPNRQH